MEERPANRRGREPILKPDEQTLDLLREFGRRGFNLAECARRLDVHPDTFRKFLRERPAAHQALQAGKAERRALLLTDPPRSTALPELETPLIGETCPTCGGKVAREDDTIILTAGQMAEARRQLEDLIDRYIAASESPEFFEDGRPASAGAEGKR